MFLSVGQQYEAARPKVIGITSFFHDEKSLTIEFQAASTEGPVKEKNHYMREERDTLFLKRRVTLIVNCMLNLKFG